MKTAPLPPLLPKKFLKYFPKHFFVDFLRTNARFNHLLQISAKPHCHWKICPKICPLFGDLRTQKHTHGQHIPLPLTCYIAPPGAKGSRRA